MKKLTSYMIALFLVTGSLAGCSNTSASDTSSSTSVAETAVDAAPQSSNTDTENSTTEKSSETKTRLYADLNDREVEIPVKPERIVTVNMTAEAIALGLKPVGAADNWLANLTDSDKKDIESIGSVGNLSMETILGLEPDLIITPRNITDESKIENLNKIAPTVVGPFFGDALENLRIMGDILGRSQEAEEWISAYEEKASSTKEQLSGIIEEGKTAMVVQLSPARTIYIYPISTWPTIYDVLGLTLPSVEELESLSSGQELSLEKLGEYNPDYIFLTSTSDTETDEYKQEITSNPVWKSLDAYKNNHIYTLGSRLSAGDVLTLDWALDEVVRAVEEVN